ncbi:MAG: calcium/sodium antiporter [Clostridiales bacterium]|nr:calcium/sodium antiporter [Clostridiales bacterium]
MHILLVILLLILGIILIVKGGDLFVDAASWIAEVSGIPKLIIGATIVSVATTLPEMLVSMMAAAQGKVDMAIGNAVGSVTANLGLIMAIAIICMPGAMKRSDYLGKSLLMIAAALTIVICGFFGEVNIVISVVLLVIFGIFIWENIVSAKKSMSLDGTDTADEKKSEKPTRKVIITNIVKFVLGAAGILIGANLLVDNGSELARFFGVSERIIGVTIIAIGTSLPELITTITAVIKKQSALSVGNILGANILDLALIMPMSSVVALKPLPISSTSAMIDLPACLIVAAVAIVPAMIKSKFSRWQGVLLLVLYIAYVAITCSVPVAA